MSSLRVALGRLLRLDEWARVLPKSFKTPSLGSYPPRMCDSEASSRPLASRVGATGFRLASINSERISMLQTREPLAEGEIVRVGGHAVGGISTWTNDAVGES